MATILLQVAGSAIGSLFGPVGSAIGQAAGAIAGNLIDQSLIASTRTIRGRGLSGGRIPAADEGSPIPRVHGTMRIAGTLIWATRFEETVSVERQGGKGRGPKVETYLYHTNFALGLCEGPIAGVRRVWADGRELDLAAVDMRVHRGDGDQMPDPLIEAKQGAGRTPAWRGLAYVVFERLPLDAYGNRIPVLQFEVIRPVGDLESRIRAVAVIPGATEHGYALTPVTETPGPGQRRFINRNSRLAETDWTASIDELQAVCPGLRHVALVVSWVGTDLRADQCRFVPVVEVPNRPGESRSWKVGNSVRSIARVSSQTAGSAAYGGTPDDRSVIEAIVDIKARGLKVTLYPFVLMDIPAGNGLPDPYGGTEQATLPWRGRITAHPAPDRPGSPDRSVAMDAAISTLCGNATPADIQVGGDGSVTWTSTDEGYRRMVLHHAGLALAAGGVDAFVIGSELTGLTRLRNHLGAFPFVDALAGLAADVAAMLGAATTVTYAADWTEFAGYRPADGSGDHFFHLDPLWAHPAIGAIGIDNYMPLSDWRDDDLSAANPDGARHANDRGAMRSAIASGELFDWYYPTFEARSERIRVPITDGLAGKPWVYRIKDIAGWWSNLHYDRIGGAERLTPTAWMPSAKPIWFTELGCPAVDKGANQPNVFPDPRSSEGSLPYFSAGGRDDAAQRAVLSAHVNHWLGPAAPPGMVDPERIYLWTWDARPYPAFPETGALWADGGNWRTGHWLNGRLGAAALADVIAAILGEAGIDRFDVSAVDGALTGHVAADTASARALLSPLLDVFAIDMREGAEGLVFASRLRVSADPSTLTNVVDAEDGPWFEHVRAEEGELASEAAFTHFDPAFDHMPSVALSRRLDGLASHQRQLSASVSFDSGLARATADAWLKDHWAARNRLTFALPPSAVSLEPGDKIRLAVDGAPAGRYRIIRIEDGAVRRIEALGEATVVATAEPTTSVVRTAADVALGFAPDLVLMDLPVLSGDQPNVWARAAAFARPWRPMTLSSSPEGEGYGQAVRLDAPARIGRLAAALPPGGMEGRIDRGTVLEVDLGFGGLESISRAALLDGANAAAVETTDGRFEVLQFETAMETTAQRWRLTGLLRGQAGTDDAMAMGAPTGARFVFIDRSVRPLGLAASDAGRIRFYVAEALAGGHAATAPLAFEGGIRALMPLSPAHLRAVREASGLKIRWIRRGRINADSWTPTEISLDEGAERYRIEIMDGVTVRRAVEVVSPEWLYPAALETADFGAPVSAITIRVAQGGAGVPWGVARTATIAV